MRKLSLSKKETETTLKARSLKVRISNSTTAVIKFFVQKTATADSLCQGASDNTTVKVVMATTFKHFPKLPAELRLKIWELCVSRSRTIEITFSRHPTAARLIIPSYPLPLQHQYRPHYVSINIPRIPLLGVNRESRHVAKLTYPTTIVSLLRHATRAPFTRVQLIHPPVPLNLLTDRLFCSPTRASDLRYAIMRLELHNLRILTIAFHELWYEAQYTHGLGVVFQVVANQLRSLEVFEVVVGTTKFDKDCYMGEARYVEITPEMDMELPGRVRAVLPPGQVETLTETLVLAAGLRGWHARRVELENEKGEAALGQSFRFKVCLMAKQQWLRGKGVWLVRYKQYLPDEKWGRLCLNELAIVVGRDDEMGDFVVEGNFYRGVPEMFDERVQI